MDTINRCNLKLSKPLSICMHIFTEFTRLSEVTVQCELTATLIIKETVHTLTL